MWWSDKPLEESVACSLIRCCQQCYFIMLLWSTPVCCRSGIYGCEKILFLDWLSLVFFWRVVRWLLWLDMFIQGSVQGYIGAGWMLFRLYLITLFYNLRMLSVCFHWEIKQFSTTRAVMLVDVMGNVYLTNYGHKLVFLNLSARVNHDNMCS